VIIDFIIPSKDKETEKRHRGRHMQIEYSLERGGKYLIRDLGIGFGAFVRLDKALELKDNHLLNMGESFIIVNLINEKASSAYALSEHDDQPKHLTTNSAHPTTKLRLKLFGGPSTGEVFYFRPEFDPHAPSDQQPTTIVKIGRSNSCDVVIEDAVLSKL